MRQSAEKPPGDSGRIISTSLYGMTSTGPEEVSDERLHEFMAKMKKEGKGPVIPASLLPTGNMASLLREATRSAYHDVALVSYNSPIPKI